MTSSSNDLQSYIKTIEDRFGKHVADLFIELNKRIDNKVLLGDFSAPFPLNNSTLQELIGPEIKEVEDRIRNRIETTDFFAPIDWLSKSADNGRAEFYEKQSWSCDNGDFDAEKLNNGGAFDTAFSPEALDIDFRDNGGSPRSLIENIEIVNRKFDDSGVALKNMLSKMFDELTILKKSELISGFNEYTKPLVELQREIIYPYINLILSFQNFVNYLPEINKFGKNTRNLYLNSVKDISDLDFDCGLRFASASYKSLDYINGNGRFNSDSLNFIKEYTDIVKILIERNKKPDINNFKPDNILNELLDDKNYKELVEKIPNRLYRRYIESTTRLTSLDLSDLWYTKGSHKYGDSQIYNKTYSLPERTLLEKEIENIIKSLNQKDFFYVDWGCGDGKKTELIIDTAIKLGKSDINVFLVDSERRTALRTSNKIGNKFGSRIKLYVDIDLFENLRDGFLYNSFKQDAGHNIVFHSLLGNTFSNFEPNKIIELLRKTLDSNDIMFSSIHLYDGNIEKLRKPYIDLKDIAFNPLRSWNFEPSEFNYSVRGETYKDTSIMTIRTYFMPNRPIDEKLIKFDKNAEISTILSIKYTEDQFRDLMNSNFNICDSYKNDNVGMFLIKKK